MDDIDFRTKVTRADFESLTADLIERARKPIEDVLRDAKMGLVSVHVMSACLCHYIPSVVYSCFTPLHHRPTSAPLSSTADPPGSRQSKLRSKLSLGSECHPSPTGI